MVAGKQLLLFTVMVAALLTAVAVPRVAGQGLQNVLHARAHVFTAVGPGVTAIKRDSSGHYFILAEPASVVSIFDGAGKRLGQIPNAKSQAVVIRYAVAIDVDTHGRLFVADRGDNTIKIFAPDGSPVATIHVTAPTSVVALSDGQLAVTTLQSKRLVQIMDEAGATIRTFGDPADQSGGDTSKQPLADRGRITGDPFGNIYFAFTSLPDPTLQRFDRFGYSAYGAVLSADEIGPLARRTGREVDLGYTMSGLAPGTSVGAWTDLHSLTALSVGNRPRRGAGPGTSPSAANSSSSFSSPSSSSTTGTTTIDGNALDYNAGDSSNALDSNTSIFAATGNPDLNLAIGQGYFTPGAFGMGFGDPFRDGMMRGGFHDAGGSGFGGGSNFGGAGPDLVGGGGGGFSDHFPDGRDGFHGRPGFGLYRAAATLRVALDDPSKKTGEKSVITAVGVDPETQEVWTAVGDLLVHLDKTGNRLDSYYPMIAEGTSLKITSMLVEPDRILIAANPWGIYEFPRPDRATQSPTSQYRIVPEMAPSTPQSPAAH